MCSHPVLLSSTRQFFSRLEIFESWNITVRIIESASMTGGLLGRQLLMRTSALDCSRLTGRRRSRTSEKSDSMPWSRRKPKYQPWLRCMTSSDVCTRNISRARSPPTASKTERKSRTGQARLCREKERWVTGTRGPGETMGAAAAPRRDRGRGTVMARDLPTDQGDAGTAIARHAATTDAIGRDRFRTEPCTAGTGAMTDGDHVHDGDPDPEAILVIPATRPHRRPSMWRRVKR